MFRMIRLLAYSIYLSRFCILLPRFCYFTTKLTAPSFWLFLPFKPPYFSCVSHSACAFILLVHSSFLPCSDTPLSVYALLGPIVFFHSSCLGCCYALREVHLQGLANLLLFNHTCMFQPRPKVESYNTNAFYIQIGARRQKGLAPGPPSSSGCSCTCLLYTSDAADE